MTAYTSGTSSFNLAFNEIVEECYERCGIEVRTGYQLRTARRSFNLMTIDWANRGINLWTIEQGIIPLVTGQVAYPLPVDTIDLLDHVIRQQANTTGQMDINITRISETMYSTIPNKLAQGRPIQVWVNRQSGNINPTNATIQGNGAGSTSISATDTTIVLSDTSSLPAAGYINVGNETIYYTAVSGNSLLLCARGQNGTTAAAALTNTPVYLNYLPNINVWPTPDAGGNYSFVYWRMRRIQDSGTGVNIEDIPFRFIPCLVAGLSYYIALKTPQGMAKLDILKQQYDEAWDMAASQDREKASLRLAPRQMFW